MTFSVTDFTSQKQAVEKKSTRKMMKLNLFFIFAIVAYTD